MHWKSFHHFRTCCIILSLYLYYAFCFAHSQLRTVVPSLDAEMCANTHKHAHGFANLLKLNFLDRKRNVWDYNAVDIRLKLHSTDSQHFTGCIDRFFVILNLLRRPGNNVVTSVVIQQVTDFYLWIVTLLVLIMLIMLEQALHTGELCVFWLIHSSW